jgi:hypothetical protein
LCAPIMLNCAMRPSGGRNGRLLLLHSCRLVMKFSESWSEPWTRNSPARITSTGGESIRRIRFMWSKSKMWNGWITTGYYCSMGFRCMPG